MNTITSINSRSQGQIYGAKPTLQELESILEADPMTRAVNHCGGLVAKFVAIDFSLTNRPSFYIALTTMIIGMQLFLTGFIAELIARNAPERNTYLIETKSGSLVRSVITALLAAYGLWNFVGLARL